MRRAPGSTTRSDRQPVQHWHLFRRAGARRPGAASASRPLIRSAHAAIFQACAGGSSAGARRPSTRANDNPPRRSTTPPPAGRLAPRPGHGRQGVAVLPFMTETPRAVSSQFVADWRRRSVSEHCHRAQEPVQPRCKALHPDRHSLVRSRLSGIVGATETRERGDGYG